MPTHPHAAGSINLRPAAREDIPEILALIKDLAAYEREPEAAVATAAQLERALFGDPARDGKGAGVAECVMGEIVGEDGEARVEGMALFFHNFSTWTGKPGIYLEDLFVRPPARGHGLGKALLLHLAKLAVERGCGRLEWAVLDWNAPAIGFYKSLGAVGLDEWTINRVTGATLEKLASESRH